MLKDTYGETGLVVVEWHVSQGLQNADGIARRDAYGTYATPTAWFDGIQSLSGGGNSSSATSSLVASYGAVIDAHRAVGSPLEVEATYVSASPNLVVTVDVTPAGGGTFDPAGQGVRVILYEEDVAYCCDNNGSDRFPHVGRSISAAQPLEFAEGRARSVHILPVDPAWNAANLRMVAFVQEGETGPITQADAAEPDTSAVEARSWGRTKAAYR